MVLLSACSGGERLTRADFQERANKECEVLREASDSFAKAQAPTAVGDEVAKYLRAGADQLRRMLGRVDELPPPEEMEDGVEELLEVLGEYADGLDTLASRAGPEQGFQDVLQESPRIVRELNDLAERATNLVAELGLIGCVLPA